MEQPVIPEQGNKVLQIAVGFEMKKGLTCVAVDTHRKCVFAVQSGSVEPYVTWKYDWDADNDTYVFWHGHYFRSVTNAAKDFQERS